MDRGAWRATEHGVTKSWTRLKRLSKHARMSGKTNKKSKEKVRLEVTSKREMELLLRMGRWGAFGMLVVLS